MGSAGSCLPLRKASWLLGGLSPLPKVCVVPPCTTLWDSAHALVLVLVSTASGGLFSFRCVSPSSGEWLLVQEAINLGVKFMYLETNVSAWLFRVVHETCAM